MSTKDATATEKPKRGQGRKVVTPDKATFGVDTKQAQYARLIVFNHAKRDHKALSITWNREWDVNSVPDQVLEKAAKALTGGNMLSGPDGLALIQELTKDGSTTGRPLTKAYAAEVRPVVRRLQFSSQFGRRGPKPRVAKANGAATKEPAAKKTPAPQAKKVAKA